MGGKKYTITLWVMMRRIIYEFLNTKFKGVLITHQRFDLSDKLMEKFITDKGDGIVEFVRFHSGKDVRTRVNNFLIGDIMRYFDIDRFDVEIYVLEWCRHKSTNVIEM